MRRDQDTAVTVGAGLQEFRLVHPEFVPAEAESEHVAGVGIDFAAGEHQELVPPAQFLHPFICPERVVICQADTVQPSGL